MKDVHTPATDANKKEMLGVVSYLANTARTIPEKVVPLSPSLLLPAVGDLRQQVVHRHCQHWQGAQLVG